MKIMHVELGRHMLGGPRQVVSLLTGLADHPVENVLVCERTSALAQTFRDPAVGRRHVELGLADEFDAGLMPQLRRLIRGERPDLIHLHCRRGDFLCAVAARLEGVPLIVSWRTDDPPSWFDRLVKYPMVDRFIAISSAIESNLRRAGVPAEQISCARDAVDTSLFRPQRDRSWFAREFGIEERRLVVGVAAALIPRKGHEVLLEAFPRVLAAHPQIRLLLFGKGWLKSRIERFVRDRQMERSVRLAGHRTDMHRVLPCLDVLVHPAWREGMGVALLEAAACGVPIVASRVGGIPEVVRNGLNGYLVKPGDFEGLAKALIRLLDDPQTRLAFGRAGRHVAVSRFPVERMVEENYRVYRRLAAMRGIAEVEARLPAAGLQGRSADAA